MISKILNRAPKLQILLFSLFLALSLFFSSHSSPTCLSGRDFDANAEFSISMAACSKSFFSILNCRANRRRGPGGCTLFKISASSSAMLVGNDASSSRSAYCSTCATRTHITHVQHLEIFIIELHVLMTAFSTFCCHQPLEMTVALKVRTFKPYCQGTCQV